MQKSRLNQVTTSRGNNRCLFCVGGKQMRWEAEEEYQEAAGKEKGSAREVDWNKTIKKAGS